MQTKTSRTIALYLPVSHPVYIDAIHYSVRDNGVIRKLAAYVILGINTEGSALYHDEIVPVHF